jgi:dGTPase
VSKAPPPGDRERGGAPERATKKEALGRISLSVEDYEAGLSSLAQRSAASRGRERPETACLVRTPFQRDRDRIVHSKAFRRLKHKTQVFIDPEGDHFRTRLTHTLEAAGIARTVARALRLNEDLTEAIALGHDLGHTPFGHAGEEALNEVLRSLGSPAPFRHNEQSLRVVEYVENEGKGLNLTWEVRDGILHHTGPERPATLEARIVKICDRVAYINHDIDDALRAGLLTEGDLPSAPLALLGSTPSERIDMLVHDLIDASDAAGDIAQSPPVAAAMDDLRTFLFDTVYARSIEGESALWVRRVVADLVHHFLASAPGGAEAASRPPPPAPSDPAELPVRSAPPDPAAAHLWSSAPCPHRPLPDAGRSAGAADPPPQWGPGSGPGPRSAASGRPAPEQLAAVVDYVAGMTDRYAERIWRQITGREEA